jgi:hypothetical protein
LSIYRTEYHQVARLSFSMWNRDAGSPSFGSFDRLWWGWKFKDFGDSTLQYAARLTIPYAEETGAGDILPPLLDGFVQHVKDIQLRDGSFDQCYPNERTPGVIYDVLSTLVMVRNSRRITETRAAELDEIMRTAVRFCLRTDEKHGEVANHIAEFAYELLQYAAFSGDQDARHRGEQYLERLMSLFERQEGWFHEYHGPDAGYQTRALRYVVKCAELLDSTELWDVAERGAAFVSDLLMPDGTVHPMLGVRATALVYPSAFERLAARNHRFRPLADRVRYAWEQRRVPMPSAIDFQNAIRLADDARETAELVRNVPAPAIPPVQEATSGWKTFEKAGISFFRDENRAVYVGTRLGGPVVIYDRKPDGDWAMEYEDAGYLLREGGARYVTRAPNGGVIAAMSHDRISTSAQFQQSLHDEVTPFRMVILRLLNLTLLRSQWVGDLFRKVVVSRLMGTSRKLTMRMHREVIRSSDAVTIADRIEGTSEGQLFRCRRVTGMHMASSRYFQSGELVLLPLEWMRDVPWGSSGTTCSSIVVPAGRSGQEQASQ